MLGKVDSVTVCYVIYKYSSAERSGDRAMVRQGRKSCGNEKVSERETTYLMKN